MIRIVYAGSSPPDSPDGVQCLHLPALRTKALSFVIPADGNVAVFFSRNAVKAAVANRDFGTREWKEVWAVGDRTAEELRRCGVESVRVADGNFASFLELQNLGDGEGVVVFGLKDSPRSVKSALPKSQEIDVYESQAISDDSYRQKAEDFDPDWVIVGSPRAWESVRTWKPARCRVAVLGDSTASELDEVDHIAAVPSVYELMVELRDRKDEI